MKTGFGREKYRKSWTREADWYEPDYLEGGVRCTLCPHGCVLGEGQRGSCRVRLSEGGKLYTTVFGNPCAANVDPIEKKPFYHFLPGSEAFSIATAGCNLHCLNCQNWEISQAKAEDVPSFDMEPKKVIEEAISANCSSIAYTYTEPLVYYEYTYETAQLAREQGLRNLLVTAGYINPSPLKKLCRVVDAANVDLKGFDPVVYRKLNSVRLEPVLKSLEVMREEGLWIEVSNLIIPNMTDDLQKIREMCKWIKTNLGAETPLHFLRFHPTYRLKNLPVTPIEALRQAGNIAMEEGIEFVYLGNVPVSQNTACPNCGKVVVEREGFATVKNRLKDGKCECGREIPGVWGPGTRP